ncbi:MAG: hypothetical protein HC803_04650 [Saprospiraceae bacterium]|nr:hypothetical protein [Saprospiraceae bacterium]
MKPEQIKKKSGQIEEYQVEKLKKSIESVGLSEKEAVEVIEEFEERKRKNGITTRQLHYETFQLIRKRSNAAAARYNIKRAILELGPSGYPFERFFGAILSQLGYETQVGIILEGNCLTHEVDVLADKGNDRIMVECKFKNRDLHKLMQKRLCTFRHDFRIYLVHGDMTKMYQKIISFVSQRILDFHQMRLNMAIVCKCCW